MTPWARPSSLALFSYLRRWPFPRARTRILRWTSTRLHDMILTATDLGVLHMDNIDGTIRGFEGGHRAAGDAQDALAEPLCPARRARRARGGAGGDRRGRGRRRAPPGGAQPGALFLRPPPAAWTTAWTANRPRPARPPCAMTPWPASWTAWRTPSPPRRRNCAAWTAASGAMRSCWSARPPCSRPPAPPRARGWASWSGARPPLVRRSREIDEALAAGARAEQLALEVLESLSSASTWGLVDMVSDSFFSDMIKYSHIDEAQSRIEALQAQLRRFGTELRDVDGRGMGSEHPDRRLFDLRRTISSTISLSTWP